MPGSAAWTSAKISSVPASIWSNFRKTTPSINLALASFEGQIHCQVLQSNSVRRRHPPHDASVATRISRHRLPCYQSGQCPAGHRSGGKRSDTIASVGLRTAHAGFGITHEEENVDILNFLVGGDPAPALLSFSSRLDPERTQILVSA